MCKTPVRPVRIQTTFAHTNIADCRATWYRNPKGLEGFALSAMCVIEYSPPPPAGEICKARVQDIGTRFLPCCYVCLSLEHIQQHVVLNPSLSLNSRGDPPGVIVRVFRYFISSPPSDSMSEPQHN